MKCITYQNETGQRCPNKVSTAAHIRALGLCRKCYGSFVLVLFASCASPADIEFMVRAHWSNIRELRKLISERKRAS